MRARLVSLLRSKNMSQEVQYKLIVEGNLKVLFKGVWMKEIPFPVEGDEITIGVMDPENNIFPDINLRAYRLDGGDPYISRKHARFFMEDGKIFIEDFCRNNSTSINNKIDIINGEKKEIQVGTKVFISESIVLRLEEGDVEQDVIESKEMLPDDNLESTEDNELDNDEKALVYLEVNGQIPLFFKPKNSFSYMIELNPTEWANDIDGFPALQIGRRSTEDEIYPDIDLWKFYFNDGDEYIARRHARIVYEDNKFYFQDLSGKGSTWVNQKDEDHRLIHSDTNEAKHEIQDGDKLIISDSAVFTVTFVTQ